MERYQTGGPGGTQNGYRVSGGGKSSLGYLFGEPPEPKADSRSVSPFRAADAPAGLRSDRVIRDGAEPVPFMTAGYLEAQVMESPKEFRRTSIGRQDPAPTRSMADCLTMEEPDAKDEARAANGAATPNKVQKARPKEGTGSGGVSQLGYLFGKE